MAFEFEPDADANDLGVYAFQGGQVSCTPPAVVPSFEYEVKRIWSELNPRFVPLWITNHWKSPNGGKSVTHHFAIGAYVTKGDFERPHIQGLLMPTTPVYGRMPRQPIVLYDILDGLTPEERNHGVLPRWESITEQSLHFARYRAWVERHKSHRQQSREYSRFEKEREAKWKAEIKDNLKYRKRHHDFDLAKAWGAANRIYVPTSFGAAA